MGKSKALYHLVVKMCKTKYPCCLTDTVNNSMDRKKLSDKTETHQQNQSHEILKKGNLWRRRLRNFAIRQERAHHLFQLHPDIYVKITVTISSSANRPRTLTAFICSCKSVKNKENSFLDYWKLTSKHSAIWTKIFCSIFSRATVPNCSSSKSMSIDLECRPSCLLNKKN